MAKILVIVSILFLTSSIGCGKHFFILSDKEMNKMAQTAREPALGNFVVYKNGDTLKNKAAQRKYKKVSGFEMRWVLDDNSINPSNVHSYQTEDAYYLYGNDREYARLIKGEVSLFVNHSTEIKMNYERSEAIVFYLQKGTSFDRMSYAVLKASIEDNPAALKQMKKEFPQTSKPNRDLTDYRSFSRILDIYNHN